MPTQRKVTYIKLYIYIKKSFLEWKHKFVHQQSPPLFRAKILGQEL